MKILFVGQIGPGQTSKMRMDALRQLGHEVAGVNSETPWRKRGWLSRRLHRYVRFAGPIRELNAQIRSAAAEFRPDLTWAEKQEFVVPETLEYLRDMGSTVAHYTPDPYFTLDFKQTRLTELAYPLYDYLVTSKQYELDQYAKLGPTIIYMPLGFSPEVHRPLQPESPRDRAFFDSDVAFVGGWEPRRERLIESILRLGLRVKVWGYGWDHLVDGRWTPRRAVRLRVLAGDQPYEFQKRSVLSEAIVGGEIYDDDYAKAISCARIALGFLRKICPEQHTTRTFEIPACGTMLLADRTDEHREFFEEGVEAEFFGTDEELLDKIRFYGSNDGAREKLASAGHHRAMTSGYTYLDRLQAALSEMDVKR